MQNKGCKKVICCILAGAMLFSMGIGSSVEAAKKTSLKTKKLTLKEGASKKIVIKNKNKKRSYTFKSSKPSVAKVNKSGKVTAVKKGSAKITVKESWKVGKKTKKRTIGSVKVKVKAKDIVVTPTTVPTNAPTTVPTIVPTTVPTAPAVVWPTEAPVEPTKEPVINLAYNTYTYDFEEDASDFEDVTITDSDKASGSKSAKANGTTKLMMNKRIGHSAVCKISADVKQTSGENKTLTVSYDGTKLNNQAFNESSDSVDVVSGEWTNYTFTINIDMYMIDCNIVFDMDGTEFLIDNVVVETQPFDGADYKDMVEKTFIQTGNANRLKKVIEKAGKGEDVTLAFLGGSITEGFNSSSRTDNNFYCYAEETYNEFKEAFGAGDGSNVHFINAGMSGTASSLGVIRYYNDVIGQMEYGKYPDFLCIEYVVNDSGECTNGEGMESIIRTALSQGTAVLLMFSHTINYETGKEDHYRPLGELYDIAMASMRSGLTTVIDQNNKAGCDATLWYYGNDNLHPDYPGDAYMADSIMNVFFKALEDTDDTEPSDDIAGIAPKYGNAFEGMKMLTNKTNPDEEESVVSMELGSFGDVDQSQPQLAYEKGGVTGVKWFPDCFMHTSGSDSFKATIKCNSLMLAHKITSDKSYGEAEIYVDGKLKGTMNCYNQSGWNNAEMLVVFKDEQVAEHEIEIKMKSGSENKKFTIYAIGFANKDEYKASLE